MRDDKENLIVKLTFEFALDIISFPRDLEANKKFAVANKLSDKVLNRRERS